MALNATLAPLMPWLLGVYAAVMLVCLGLVIKSQVDWRRADYVLERVSARNVGIRALQVALAATALVVTLVVLSLIP